MSTTWAVTQTTGVKQRLRGSAGGGGEKSLIANVCKDIENETNWWWTPDIKPGPVRLERASHANAKGHPSRGRSPVTPLRGPVLRP